MWRGLDRITVNAYNWHQFEECEMFLEPWLHSLFCIYWVFAHELYCTEIKSFKKYFEFSKKERKIEVSQLKKNN